jgi:hypothetical protein
MFRTEELTMKAVVYRNGEPFDTLKQGEEEDAGHFIEGCSKLYSIYSERYPEDKLQVQYESLAGIARK